MPMQFEYDPKGDVFTYFIMSFGALILTPVTFYKWSSSGVSKEQTRLNSLRDRHGKSRWFSSKENELKKDARTPWLRRLAIIATWVLLGYMGFAASQMHEEFVPDFDPFQILGVNRDDFTDFDSFKKPAKKLYRDLSRTLHPDKKCAEWMKENDGQACTEEVKAEFDANWALIVKAHETLTDENSFENYQKYGNPDGQLVTKFGIALPSWIVAEENHLYVLGVYGFLFGIMLPATVGSWWYRSLQFTGDQVLIKTTRMFEYYLYKTALMNRRRALMVFSGAFEFKREHNKEIEERENDSEELIQLVKKIEEHERNIAKPPTDQPFPQPYATKVRILYFAHMYNIDLSPELEADLSTILKKVPLLHGEMITKTHALTQQMMQMGQVQHIPKVETLDNIIKNQQNLTQGLGLNQRSGAFWQLPHFREEFIRYLNAKKARTLRQLAARPTEEIRGIFKNLVDEEFNEMMDVLRNLPALNLDVNVRVEDDSDEEKVTAGSIVTITIGLKRQTCGDIIDAADNDEEMIVNDGEFGEAKVTPAEKKEANQAPKKKVTAKKGPAAAAAKREARAAREAAGEVVKDDSEEESESTELVAKEDSESEDEEEKTWKKLQKRSKKRENVWTKDNSKMTHTVYAPRYPAEKQEWWWAYLVMVNPKREKSTERLITEPINVTNLVDEEEVDIKFQAPSQSGRYNFTIYVRSDSYIELDVRHQFTMEVHERPEIPEIHPQWQDSEDEDAGDMDGGFITDSEAEPDVSSSSEEEDSD